MKLFNYFKEGTRYGDRVLVPNVPKIITHLVVALVLLVVLLGSFGTVPVGHKGIRLTVDKISGVVENGFYMKIPFAQKIVKMNVQTQKEEIDAEAASKDLQNVSAKVALNYNLYPDKVAELYSRIGNDYKSRIIAPAIQEAVKSATAKYTAEELITKRAEVRDNMKASLVARLATDFIQVSEVSIVNFDFSNSFNQAIEAKVTAEQDALAAKNKLEQVKFEAEQRVASAEAEARAIKIQAEAVTQQGGKDYVQLKAIEKWDGHLPQQMIPGSTVPFLNLTK